MPQIKKRYTKTCEECDRKPRYGFDGEGEMVRRCRDHREEGMFDQMNKRCGDPECNKQASFGSEPKKPLFCFEHKRDEMMNVCNKMCEHEGCMKTPKFGLIEKRPTHCKEHSSSNMVDVAHKLCETDGCEKRASYGFESQRPLYCAKHAKEVPETRDVVTGKCKQADCPIKPSYGLPGQKAEYCKKHKSDEMSYQGQQCYRNGCTKQPCFGYEGSRSLYCSSHKLTGMIDLHNKRCIAEDCSVTACYGYAKDNVSWCAFHGKRQSPPASLMAGKRCEDANCDVVANFGLPTILTKRFCGKHKSDGMINLSEKRQDCINCALSFPLTSRSSSDLCIYCRPDSHQRLKETIVDEKLKASFPSLNFIRNDYRNSRLRRAQLRFRPDFWLELEDHILIIEVDEHGHVSYENECEIARMIQIAISCPDKPISFIRFNPDGKNPSHDFRHDSLIDTVRSDIERTAQTDISVKYLFYPTEKVNKLECLLDSAAKDIGLALSK